MRSAAPPANGARVPLRTLLVASNANVGGVGTALAMATAMGWPRLLAPAAAAGTLGYAVATFIGVAGTPHAHESG